MHFNISFIIIHIFFPKMFAMNVRVFENCMSNTFSFCHDPVWHINQGWHSKPCEHFCVLFSMTFLGKCDFLGYDVPKLLVSATRYSNIYVWELNLTYKVFGKSCNSFDVWYIHNFLGYRSMLFMNESSPSWRVCIHVIFM